MRKAFALGNLGEVYRLYGEPGRFVRSNLFLLWLAAFFLFWLFNPVEAFPYPGEVARALRKLCDAPGTSNLVYNTWVTLKLNAVGTALATILSLAVAYLGVLPVFQPFNRAMQALRYLPIVGFNLAFITVFAIGWEMKLAMFTTGMSFFLVTGMTGVIRSIPPLKFEHARVLGYTEWQTFRAVVVRGAMPQMLEVVAQTAAIGWVMITAIETFNRTEGGIGSQIEIYCATNQLAEVYAYLVVIGCVAVVADWGFRLLRRALFPYTTVAERA